MTTHTYHIDTNGIVKDHHTALIGDLIGFDGSTSKYQTIYIFYDGEASTEPFGTFSVGSSTQPKVIDGIWKSFYLSTSSSPFHDPSKTNGKLTVKPNQPPP